MKKSDFKCFKCKKIVDILCQFTGYSGIKADESKWFCEDCFKKMEKRNGYKEEVEEWQVYTENT